MRAFLTIAVTAAMGFTLAHSANKELPMPKDPETGKFTYQAVVHVEGIDAEELHRRAIVWVATDYRSAPDVLKLDDPAGRRIIVKGYFEIHAWLKTLPIRHTLSIEVKEGRYRYTITDLVLESPTLTSALDDDDPRMMSRKKILSRTHDAIQLLLGDLKTAMQTPAVSDDW